MPPKILLAAALLTIPALSQQPSAAALAHRVDDHYNHLTSLRAHFSERYRGLGMDRVESGILTLRKPGRMRWAYDTPRGKLFLLDGHDAILYSPGDPNAQRLPAKQLDDLRSPLRFLLGRTQLAKELDNLTVTSISLPNGATAYTLTGAPHGMAQRIRSIALTVNTQGEIQSMRATEPDGATTDFVFTDQHENVPTSDADFHFTPPPGISIVTAPKPVQ